MGEEFGFTINAHCKTMYLTFHNERFGPVAQPRSLVRGADTKNIPQTYGGDSLYFKVSAYNQCSTKTGGGNWYAGCAGAGAWETDKANGD